MRLKKVFFVLQLVINCTLSAYLSATFFINIADSLVSKVICGFIGVVSVFAQVSVLVFLDRGKLQTLCSIFFFCLSLLATVTNVGSMAILNDNTVLLNQLDDSLADYKKQKDSYFEQLAELQKQQSLITTSNIASKNRSVWAPELKAENLNVQIENIQNKLSELDSNIKSINKEKIVKRKDNKVGAGLLILASIFNITTDLTRLLIAILAGIAVELGVLIGIFCFRNVANKDRLQRLANKFGGIDKLADKFGLNVSELNKMLGD